MMLVGVSLQRHLTDSHGERNLEKEDLRAALLALCCSGCLWSSALVNAFCVGGTQQFRFNKAIRMTPRLLLAALLPLLPENYAEWHLHWTIQIWIPGILMMIAVFVERCLSTPLHPPQQLLELGTSNDDGLAGDVADIEEDLRIDRSLELADTAHTRSHSLSSSYSGSRLISSSRSDPRQSYVARARVVSGGAAAHGE